MTSEPMKYKGYFGSADISVEDNVLHGRLLFIKDVVSYEAETPQELRLAFHEAVDDYLATCAELGDTPDAPFKGTFNVRVGQDRHREAVLAARRRGQSLNDYVTQAIDFSLSKTVTQPPVNIILASFNEMSSRLTTGFIANQQWVKHVTATANPARH